MSTAGWLLPQDGCQALVSHKSEQRYRVPASPIAGLGGCRMDAAVVDKRFTAI